MTKKTKRTKKNLQHVDTVNQDFWRAVVVVSLSANLVVFVTWLTWYISNS